MMAEYIEREAAIRALTLHDCDSARAKMAICDLPAADVAPVRHGKWISRVDTDTPMYECSVCGARVVKGLYEYNNPNKYCYHCGAKMDLEDS